MLTILCMHASCFYLCLKHFYVFVYIYCIDICIFTILHCTLLPLIKILIYCLCIDIYLPYCNVYLHIVYIWRSHCPHLLHTCLLSQSLSQIDIENYIDQQSSKFVIYNQTNQVLQIYRDYIQYRQIIFNLFKELQKMAFNLTQSSVVGRHNRSWQH